MFSWRNHLVLNPDWLIRGLPGDFASLRINSTRQVRLTDINRPSQHTHTRTSEANQEKWAFEDHYIKKRKLINLFRWVYSPEFSPGLWWQKPGKLISCQDAWREATSRQMTSCLVLCKGFGIGRQLRVCFWLKKKIQLKSFLVSIVLGVNVNVH